MTMHVLKIAIKYADEVLDGTKSFEIRKNDRDFKVGDEIMFEVVDNEGHRVGEAVRHQLNHVIYRIDYVLDGFEGLAQTYVALAISRDRDLYYAGTEGGDRCK